MWSPGSELPSSSPLAAHTFTDTDLQSLIVGLDNGHPDLDSLLGGLQGSAGLQFLPHLPADDGAAAAASHQPPEQPAVFVPADLSGSGPAVLLPPALESPLLPLSLGTSEDGMACDDFGPAQQHDSQQQQQDPQQQRPQRRTHQQAQQTHAARPKGQRSRPAPPTKQPHSQVEKQRRDRINSLIDELRELVPPQGSEAAAMSALDGPTSDGRRPKHVVLADTIRLIKDMQLQLAEGQGGPEDAGGNSSSRDAQPPWHEPPALHWESEHEHEPPSQQQRQQQQQQQQQQQDSGEGSHPPHPELPHAPEDEPAAEAGVVVELEEGAIRYVKVTCPDRHGLLADIVRALKELPLEITTAAITTRRDHTCVDTFQVEVEDPLLQPADIKALVADALRLTGDKKRKADGTGT
ncbi:Transcription factor ABORTED MICROSPORES [Chlorella sorokiniana]|uniref:Transcription factor ABORTED MICROSPORES n=1 Tax=Chlorella sorokiniana TaxID=3076 RepID=A0A2P6TXU7_CHLSO|nr:Transcription factor ABORTED MICROSPORES [Chlorella sorokiniana]|eukprot:PRW58868.1 Transcription factor ABORTED MICROSPORES [Chlorella sorokiniana]